MKPALFAAAALALAATGLAGCGQEAEAPASKGPEAPEGLSVGNARLMLPAVKGNPGAVYFDIANAGVDNLTIRAVHVEGASMAMMHAMGESNGQESMNEMFQVAVPAGGTLSFKPGEMHVMAEELAEDVAPGGSVEVTLTFAGGDKLSFPAEVRAAGDER